MPDDVHSRMLEEAGVLRGHKGQDQVPGQAAVRHLDAPLVVKLADALAVPGEDLGHHRGPEILNGGEVRQVAQEMVVDEAPGRRGSQQPGEHQAINESGQAPGPAPPPMVMLQPVRVGFEEFHFRFR